MASQGTTDISSLIKSMSPSVDAETTFVFGTIPCKTPADYQNVLKLFIGLPVEMLFRESEGWTAIVPQSVAEEIQLETIFPCKKVTLNVHSSLEAVGFIAAVTTMLAKDVGVGVNPVSGYYHDHLFVPVGKEEVVMESLRKMAAEGA